MLEILLIYIQNIVVGTEYDRYAADPFDFAFSHKPEPFAIEGLASENKVGILIKVLYHDKNFRQR